MTDKPHPYGYAAIIPGPGFAMGGNSIVCSVGRSLGGMLRSLDEQQTRPTHYTTIVVTRSAFAMVKNGHVEIDGLVLFVNKAGELDAPRRSPGRPPMEGPKGEPSATFAVRLPEALRGRIEARAVKDGVTVAAVFRKALESFLEPPDAKARGMLRKLSKGEGS
jgi:predicted DNA-binding protein